MLMFSEKREFIVGKLPDFDVAGVGHHFIGHLYSVKFAEINVSSLPTVKIIIIVNVKCFYSRVSSPRYVRFLNINVRKNCLVWVVLGLDKKNKKESAPAAALPLVLTVIYQLNDLEVTEAYEHKII